MSFRMFSISFSSWVPDGGRGEESEARVPGSRGVLSGSAGERAGEGF